MAFINSVSVFSLENCLMKKRKYQLPVNVIDFHLKNLDGGNLDKANIMDNFFKYLINASKNVQMIIVKNANNFIMTDELTKKSQCRRIHLWHKRRRYGFVLGYHD